MNTAGKTAHIRWLIRQDMEEVIRIERQSFEYPWSKEDFIRYLRQKNCIGMVAEHADRVVGFMIYELHGTTIRVLNFAVAADYRRRGVGRQMIVKLKAKLTKQRRTRIALEVRETNLPAQLFFCANGFLAVCVLHHHYPDTQEDAYFMRYSLEDRDAAAFRPENRIGRFIKS